MAAELPDALGSGGARNMHAGKRFPIPVFPFPLFLTV